MADEIDHRVQMLDEAYRRNLLSPEMRAAYEEAQKRGLIANAPVSEPGVLGDVAHALGSGLAQGPIVGAGFAGDLDRLGSFVSDKLGFRTRPSRGEVKKGPVPGSEELTEFAESKVGKFYQPQTPEGKVAGSVGKFVGNPVSYAGAGGIIPKAISAAGAGAGSELLGQATEGTNLEVPGRLVGAVGGGLAPRAVARAVSPFPISPQRAATVGGLRAEGVEPTAGDVTGSRAVRYAEHHLGDAPGAGGAFSEARAQIGHDYTRAVLERIGEDADAATPEVINRARDRIGQTLEDVAERLPIRMDRRLGDDLTSISAELMNEGLLPDNPIITRITRQIQNIEDGFVTNNQNQAIMPGRVYQSLTRHGTPLSRAIDDADPTVSYYATRIRSALDDAMERAAMGRGTRPGVGRRQALEDLREARRQWYNMLIVSRAAAGPGEAAAEGIVSPQKLRQLLTSSDDKKINYARGRGNLTELARAGNEIMSPMPNSGTAQRSFLTDIPARIGTALGALGSQATHGEPISGAVIGSMAPGMAGRALMSRPAQAYLKNQAAVPAQRNMPGAAPTAARAVAGTVSQQAGESPQGQPPQLFTNTPFAPLPSDPLAPLHDFSLPVPKPQTDAGSKDKRASAEPPVKGARQAPDGKWYVDDPARPGKYLMVQDA